MGISGLNSSIQVFFGCVACVSKFGFSSTAYGFNTSVSLVVADTIVASADIEIKKTILRMIILVALKPNFPT
ncbi:MAG: hypothetical protein ACD_42C00094G0003 [uncultured bacterium]|nr:MAG: hypothetical protein ACD_42C00094G0003 [uncultured bacterium]